MEARIFIAHKMDAQKSVVQPHSRQTITEKLSLNQDTNQRLSYETRYLVYLSISHVKLPSTHLKVIMGEKGMCITLTEPEGGSDLVCNILLTHLLASHIRKFAFNK